MLSTDIELSSSTATVLFILAVVAGTQYRRNWRVNGPRWQLFFWGLLAGACLLIVAMVPLSL